MRGQRPLTTRPMLQGLKATELKRLASLIGLNNSGTRVSLLATLQRELPRPRIPTSHRAAAAATKAPLRIMSIDMGIRNLAYCVLELSSHGVKASPHCAKSTEGHAALDISHVSTAMHQSQVLDSLTLLAWRRSAISSVMSASSGVVKSKSADLDAKSSPDIEAFDPATFAKLAYALTTGVLLPHRVSHILIERQRWRSGGAPAVLEWTVRVNIFESMLHAVLETLARQWTMLPGRGEDGLDVHEAEGNLLRSLSLFPTVQSVSPKKVGTFWVDAVGGVGPNLESKTIDKAKGGAAHPLASRRSKIEKEFKIAIAEGWLRGGLKCSGDAAETRNAFLVKRGKGRATYRAEMDASGTNKQKRHRKQLPMVNVERNTELQLGLDDGRAETPAAEKMGKLDDLADCLLQGVAWVQWESNRQLITELLNLDQGDYDRPSSS